MQDIINITVTLEATITEWIVVKPLSGIVYYKTTLNRKVPPGVLLLNVRHLGTYARSGPRPPELRRHKDGGGFGIFRDP